MANFFNIFLTDFFSNRSPGRTILKNTIWLSVGTFANKLFSLALIIYAARILGAESYGAFTFALAFASLFVVLSQFGLPDIIRREFAREEENQDELYAIFSLKIILVFVTFLLIAAVSFLTIDSSEIRLLVLVMGVFLLMNSFIGTAYSYFHAQQRMEYEAWLEILQMALLVSFGLFVLFQYPSAQNLAFAYAASAAIAFAIAVVFFSVKLLPVRLRWDAVVWKKYVKMSLPLAFSAVFAVVYSYIDSVMLGYWGLLEQTGWYNAAQRVMLAGLLPMGFVASGFYPALSKFSKHSEAEFQRIWNYELEIMLLLALPLVAGGILLAPGIVLLLYSAEYAAATLALQILLATAAVNFLYRPFYDAMIILNRQNHVFKITLLGGFINVALNFLLIPSYGLYGAAAATLATYTSLLLLTMVFVRKLTYVRFPFRHIGLVVIASGLSIYAMTFTLRYLLSHEIHVLFLIPAGVTVYLSMFLLLRRYIMQRFI